jgi:hypothetical protein
MRRDRALAIVSCVLCLVTALGAGDARAASLRTVAAPAGLSAIGCMSSALCVVGGSSGLHHTAHVQILRRGRVTRTMVFPVPSLVNVRSAVPVPDNASSSLIEALTARR